MTPIFQNNVGLSAGDLQLVKSLLEIMLAGGRVTEHPLYQTFRLPESGLHITPKYLASVRPGTSYDEVSLITRASDGEIVTVASLRRGWATAKVHSDWPTLIVWSIFVISWLVFAVLSIIKALG